MTMPDEVAAIVARLEKQLADLGESVKREREDHAQLAFHSSLCRRFCVVLLRLRGSLQTDEYHWQAVADIADRLSFPLEKMNLAATAHALDRLS